MKLFTTASIQRKQTMVIMLTTVIALLLASVAFIASELLAFPKEMVRDLSQKAEIIANNTAAAIDFNDPKAAEENLSALRADPNIISATIFGADGNVFARFDRSGGSLKLERPSTPQQGYSFRSGRLDLSRPIVSKGETIGTIYITSDLGVLYARLAEYAAITVIVLLATSFVAYFISKRVQRVISSPILNLAETARTVAQDKHYSARATKQNDDELGRLVDAFNSMLDQIQQRDSALQDARNTLEKRVEERTRELKDEIVERVRTEEERDQFFTVSLDLLCIGGLDGFFKRVNPAFETVLGYNTKEITSMPFIDMVHPDDRPITVAAMENLTRGEPVRDRVVRCAHKNGTYLWIEWAATPIAEDGLFCAYGRDVTARKNDEFELGQLNKQLLETSRQAGMAEVATGVLHNVGNALNSVNVSSTLIVDTLKRSKVSGLCKVALLLRDHENDMPALMASEKGLQLVNYIVQLSNHLNTEQTNLLKETDQLRSSIEHIKEIVSMQQSYAKISGVKELVRIADLVDDSLHMNESAMIRHGVQVLRQYDEVPPMNIERHKVMQIMINLLRNAKYACDDSGRHDKLIALRIINAGNRIRICVTDNGIGIPQENLVRIFGHGFTTRKEGHGFGLHSGALAASELGGSLTVHSDGAGKGATFTLELPILTTNPAHED